MVTRPDNEAQRLRRCRSNTIHLRSVHNHTKKMSSHSHYEPLISPPTCEVPEWPLTNDLQLPIHALTQGSFGKLENNTSEEFQSILEALDSKVSEVDLKSSTL